MIDWRTTKLIDRIGWAKENLTRHDTEYCVVYEDIDMDTVAVMHPDPHCMAMLMYGGLMPPAWVKIQLQEDEQQPDFVSHKLGNGHLLHTTEPMGPLTEEEASNGSFKQLCQTYLGELERRQQTEDGYLHKETTATD